MKNAIIIVNPKARSGGGGVKWNEIESLVTKTFPEVNIEKTESPQHATQIAREAINRGVENIIAAGGDGTLHEVLNGLIKDDRLINPNVAFGVIGLGTGRDTFRSLKVGLSTKRQLKILQQGKTKFLDVGKVEMLDKHGHPRVRYFFNGSSFGVGAEAMRYVNKSEKRFGTLGFLIPALRAYHAYEPCRVLLTFDNRMTVESEILNVTICNGPYSGSGMRWTKLSKMNDGMFEVVAARKMPFWKVLLAIPRLYLGTLGKLKEVDVYQVKELRVTGDKPLPIECEGEEPGSLPATFTVLPSALRVFVP